MDIAHGYDNETMRGDLALEDGLLVSDDSLHTAVLHSLFTYARAENQYGWWGELLSPAANDRYGSKLWLLRREKQTEDTRLRAKEYAEEALAWLVTDGIASTVVVDASYPARGVLLLEISITLTSSASEVFKFTYNLGA
jgi:phage gp46-like protein